MAARGIVLAKNISVVGNQPAVNFEGGRGVLVIMATTYPTACNLQTLGQDGTTWINVNSTTISTNQATPFDLPAGQYRIGMSGGTVAGFYANIVTVTYG